jgi:hypothetical protein
MTVARRDARAPGGRGTSQRNTVDNGAVTDTGSVTVLRKKCEGVSHLSRND